MKHSIYAEFEAQITELEFVIIINLSYLLFMMEPFFKLLNALRMSIYFELILMVNYSYVDTKIIEN